MAKRDVLLLFLILESKTTLLLHYLSLSRVEGGEQSLKHLQREDPDLLLGYCSSRNRACYTAQFSRGHSSRLHRLLLSSTHMPLCAPLILLYTTLLDRKAHCKFATCTVSTLPGNRSSSPAQFARLCSCCEPLFEHYESRACIRYRCHCTIVPHNRLRLSPQLPHMHHEMCKAATRSAQRTARKILFAWTDMEAQPYGTTFEGWVLRLLLQCFFCFYCQTPRLGRTKFAIQSTPATQRCLTLSQPL